MTQRTPRLIGYARVSTDEQDPQLQVDALLSAGIEEKRIHTEFVSGASRKRPVLDKAIKTCRRGDTLVVWKLDRFARSMPDLHKRLEHMDERGIGFKSLTEGFEVTNITGRLVMNILGAIAEFERQLISQRTKAGMEAARAQGRGAPLKMTEDRIAEARLWHRDGMTYREIAERFLERDGVKITPAGVWSALKDPTR